MPKPKRLDSLQDNCLPKRERLAPLILLRRDPATGVSAPDQYRIAAAPTMPEKKHSHLCESGCSCGLAVVGRDSAGVLAKTPAAFPATLAGKQQRCRKESKTGGLASVADLSATPPPIRQAMHLSERGAGPAISADVPSRARSSFVRESLLLQRGRRSRQQRRWFRQGNRRCCSSKRVFDVTPSVSL